MNTDLFNDATMRELLGEAWQGKTRGRLNQQEPFSFYRHKELGQERREENISTNDAEMRAAEILREAAKNPDLLDAIKERAAIRWGDGLSDSLFFAVLGNLKPLNEKAERDCEGKLF